MVVGLGGLLVVVCGGCKWRARYLLTRMVELWSRVCAPVPSASAQGLFPGGLRIRDDVNCPRSICLHLSRIGGVGSRIG